MDRCLKFYVKDKAGVIGEASLELTPTLIKQFNHGGITKRLPIRSSEMNAMNAGTIKLYLEGEVGTGYAHLWLMSHSNPGCQSCDWV